MILQLDDKYRIISDEHNFILQRKADPKKNPRGYREAKEASDQWKNLGYWKDLSQLSASYSREVLRTEIGDTSLKALSRDLRTIRQAIERIGEQCVGLWKRGGSGNKRSGRAGWVSVGRHQAFEFFKPVLDDVDLGLLLG
jgi:hypothetical protein